eukprot:TRINITY_DN621_c0_g1_i1.p1 TRINITY_DN621_c0_g1~~TRINITY_DN621_c0_g1_i1.p1  ORF type:complete len:717 (-),score=144.02 TRINITY_DN621_c0_g1_i1:498-2648(-)
MEESIQTSKVRKPYTITKQRERWTEEEHLKFLEALKLYGRAWRKIEEHVGTKSAVQIRSHAQKFFSKLVKGASSKGFSSNEKLEDIEIPPPRPKKKPRHPYPRKAVATLSASSNGSQITKDTNSLPSVVSSTPLVEERPHQHAGLVPYNSSNTRKPCQGNEQDSKMESSSTNNSSVHSLKLFGQTMMVSTNEKPSNTSSFSAFHSCQGAFRKVASERQASSSPKSDTENAMPMINRVVDSQAINVSTELAINSGMSSGSLSSTDKNCKAMEFYDEQQSSDIGTNSSCLTRSQGSPGVNSNYPRHVPVQCVIGGNASEKVDDDVGKLSDVVNKSNSGSPMNSSNSASSFSNSEALNSWSATLPAYFRWLQMKPSDGSVVDAVAAATAAAASAWWSFYGVTTPFYHPRIFDGVTGADHPRNNSEKEHSEELYLFGNANGKDSGETKLNFSQNQVFQSEEGICSTMEADSENERSSNASNVSSSSDFAKDSSREENIGMKETVSSKKRLRCIEGVNKSQAEKNPNSEEVEENAISKMQFRVNKTKAGYHGDGSNSFKNRGTRSKNLKVSDKEGFEFTDLGSKEIMSVDSFPQNDSTHDVSSIMDSRIVNMGEQRSGNIAQAKSSEATESVTGTDEIPHEVIKPIISSEKAFQISGNSVSHETLRDEGKGSADLGKQKCGLGFVPYNRCSMQAYKADMDIQSEMKYEGRMGDRNAVCSEQ